jgi:hypothetical protein
MAATFEYNEDNGAATGSPAKGTSRTTAVTQVNWKAVDDVATGYATAPVNAGENSFPKYQFGKFTGTFNQISNGLWAHTAGVLPTGVTLFGAVTSSYATPSQSATAGLSDISSVTAITSGAAVLFSTVGPEGASPTATLSAAGYTQYLVTQARTTGAAPTGDSDVLTLTLRYSEN